MMRGLFVLFALLILAPPNAIAQTPADRLPSGSPIAGWAVEAIQVPEIMGRIERQRSPRAIADYAGQIGIVRKSIDPGVFSSSQFQAFDGDRQLLVFNGRAFLRVQAVQQYVLVASAAASSKRRQEPCELVMNIGGKTVVSGTFRPMSSRLYTVDPNPSTGPALLSGNVHLQPGYYPIEFIVGCLQSNEDIPIDIKFQIREERDAAPRSFANGEIFHIRR